MQCALIAQDSGADQQRFGVRASSGEIGLQVFSEIGAQVLTDAFPLTCRPIAGVPVPASPHQTGLMIIFCMLQAHSTLCPVHFTLAIRLL